MAFIVDHLVEEILREPVAWLIRADKRDYNFILKYIANARREESARLQVKKKEFEERKAAMLASIRKTVEGGK